MPDQSPELSLSNDDGIRTCRFCLWDIRKYPDGQWHLAYEDGDTTCEHDEICPT